MRRTQERMNEWTERARAPDVAFILSPEFRARWHRMHTTSIFSLDRGKFGTYCWLGWTIARLRCFNRGSPSANPQRTPSTVFSNAFRYMAFGILNAAMFEQRSLSQSFVMLCATVSNIKRLINCAKRGSLRQRFASHSYVKIYYTLCKFEILLLRNAQRKTDILFFLVEISSERRRRWSRRRYGNLYGNIVQIVPWMWFIATARCKMK